VLVQESAAAQAYAATTLLIVRRMESAKREQVKVDSGSLIHVERNVYSVNSRLIGQWKRGPYLAMVRFGTGAAEIETPAAAARAGKHRIDFGIN